MNGKLLVVDDHKQVLKAFIQLLEPEFDSITGISNPNQILSCISNEAFDVILLDMNFSAGVNTGNEGLYWLNRILKSDPLAVVVMITAYAEVLQTSGNPLVGVDFIISKPFLLDNLREAIAKTSPVNR